MKPTITDMLDLVEKEFGRDTRIKVGKIIYKKRLVFEDFLKNHQSEAEWNKYYIPTKKLGEWAWEEYVGFKEHKKTLNKTLFTDQDYKNTCDILDSCALQWEKIARACLGEELFEDRMSVCEESDER